MSARKGKQLHMVGTNSLHRHVAEKCKQPGGFQAYIIVLFKGTVAQKSWQDKGYKILRL
jgi:hypothetical protein